MSLNRKESDVIIDLQNIVEPESKSIDAKPQTIIKAEIRDLTVLSDGQIAFVTFFKQNNYYQIIIYDPETKVFLKLLPKCISDPILLPLPEGKLAFQTLHKHLELWHPGVRQIESIYKAKKDDVSNFNILCWLPTYNSFFCQIGPYRKEKSYLLNPNTKQLYNFFSKSEDPLVAGYSWNQNLVTISQFYNIDIWDIQNQINIATLSNRLLFEKLKYKCHSVLRYDTSIVEDLLMVKYQSTDLEEKRVILQIWDLRTQQIYKTFLFLQSQCRSAILLSKNRMAVAGSNEVKIFDIQTNEIIARYPIPNVIFMKILPNYDLLLGAFNQLVSLDIGLKAEFIKEYNGYQQKLLNDTILPDALTGIITEYLVAEREKLFGSKKCYTPIKMSDVKSLKM